jgi:hypothetical protein
MVPVESFELPHYPCCLHFPGYRHRYTVPIVNYPYREGVCHERPAVPGFDEIEWASGLPRVCSPNIHYFEPVLEAVREILLSRSDGIERAIFFSLSNPLMTVRLPPVY